MSPMPWLLVFVLAALAAAQERREPLRGSAVTADGKPWAAATVHLLSRPLPGDERFGRADEVTATTDANGRFLVQLLPGRFYLAWAVQDLGEARYCASLPVESLVAGRPLELVADAPRVRKRIELQGLKAWAGRGKVTATVFSATSPAIVVELEPEADALVLPPLPGRRAFLLLACGGLPFSQWPGQVDLTKEDADVEKVREPRDVRVRVVDEKNAAIAGARLSLRTIDPQGGEREVDHELARTDAKGEAIVTLPLPADRFRWHNYAFGVTAPGFAPINNIQNVDIAADHDPTKPGQAMTLRIPAGTWHTAQFVRGDTAWSGPVVLRTRRTSVGDMSFSVGLPQIHARPEAEGSLGIARLPDAQVIVLGDAAAVPLATPLAMPLHPVALLGRIGAEEAGGAVTFDLARVQPLTLQVLGPAGAPAEGATVAILVKDGRGYAGALNGLATDRSGRIAALAPAGLPLVAVAWTDDGCVIARIEPGARSDKPCVLQLAPVPAVGGVVTGKDGKPVAFARVAAWVSGVSGGDAMALGCALQRVAASTAPDGSFRLPLYPGLHYSMRGVVTAEYEHFLDQQWTVGKDEPEELPIDLARQR